MLITMLYRAAVWAFRRVNHLAQYNVALPGLAQSKTSKLLIVTLNALVLVALYQYILPTHRHFIDTGEYAAFGTDTND